MMTPIRFSLPFRLAGLWACVCAFSVPVLFSQQNLVISGGHSSGTVPCQAVNTITTSPTNPFTVSGSASVRCEAGVSITLLPGFRATAGTASPTFDAFITPMAVAPALTSPAAGASGPALTPQTFALTFLDNLGTADISSFQVSFGGTGATAGICSLSYSGGVLGLWNDSATQLLQTAPLQNSQCSVGTSQVSGAGTTLTFAVPITFFTPFQGGQEIYALAVSSSGDYHPWVDLGAWTVTAPTIQTAIFSSAGTSTWTAPAGVTSVQVDAWGPGGAGANTIYFYGQGYGSGGGGGGGAYAKKTAVAVTPGQPYTVVVGGGGSGTKTTFAGTVVVADAGVNGAQAIAIGNPGMGGAGGQASNSTGAVTQSGTNGGPGGGYGGYGGGGANGGVGGIGGYPPNGSGGAGIAPGGGGGGAAPGSGSMGGAGGGGQVVITYSGPSTTTYSITGRVTTSGAGLGGVTVAVVGTQTAATTDGNGNYSLFSLTAGATYTIRASRSGYTLSADQSFGNLAANQTANFTATAIQYYLTTIVDPTGTGTIGPTSGPYAYGSAVLVTATANSGYRFTGYSGALSGTNPSQTLTITGNTNVIANFVSITGTTVTVTPSSGISVSPGGSQQFTASVTPSMSVPWGVASGPGTITTAGVYSAPSEATPGASVTVRAAAQDGTTRSVQFALQAY